MDLGLKGKVVIVTGGARGIGGGISEVFCQEGANVVMNYHSRKEESELYAKELADKYGVKVVPVQGDVSKEEDILKIFDVALKEFGTVDVLVNNAYPFGVGMGKDIDDFEIDAYRTTAAGSIDACIISCRELVKICRKDNKPGHIVNVLSKAAFWTSSYKNLDYITNKSAMAGFTRGLAHEVAKDKIYVNGIIPGYVHNSQFDPNTDDYKRRAKYIPLGRFAEPIEMGYMVAFLSSDRSCQTNGAFIDCTGAMLNGNI